MIHPSHRRVPRSNWRAFASVICLLAVTCASTAEAAQTAEQVQPQAAQNAAAATPAAVAARPAGNTPSERQVREAESAYLAGARKLERDDSSAAEAQFRRALKLNPGNRDYALAIAVARQHQVTELVQHATRARQAGDEKTAQTLLAEARTIDPENPLVLEHSEPVLTRGASAGQAALGRTTAPTAAAPLADRTRLLVDTEALGPWKIEGPGLAGAIKIAPQQTVKDFHLRGNSSDVIRNVAAAYGIAAAIDSSVEQKQLQFDLTGVDYAAAMNAVMSMTQTFAVPVDETTVLVAKDTPADRLRLERQLQETIYLPGMSTDQINELAQVVKSVFDIKQTAVQTGLGDIVVRAPKDVLDPLNLTLKDLVDSTGEVMIEVKLYEVDKTHMINAGAAIPTQFNVFNVDQAANSIVNSNQALVQQAVAQGLVPAGTSNLAIALALIQLGLVQSNLATNLIGLIGGGVFQTGISGSSNATFNLSLNSTDTRTLDDVQLRVGDRQAATFREGDKYPIVTSTYGTGLPTASSLLGNASINGVNVSSLLQQYSGGAGSVLPQVTYEDLGVTLKATPVIEKSGRIKLTLDLKIEALSGTSLDGNPVLESRQFTSGMTVADGESALMVSSVSRNETAAMTGVPGLSELPGFQVPLEDAVEKDQSQLVVVVTPHVVRIRSDLIQGPRIPTLPIAEN